MKKKLLSAVLSIVLILSLTSGAFAFETGDIDSNTVLNTEADAFLEQGLTTVIFEEDYEYFFENPSNCVVRDLNGNDISTLLYDDYIDSYVNGDISTIHQYVIENISSISWTREYLNEPQTRGAIQTKTVEATEILVRGVVGHSEKRIEARITVTGTYTYNYNTGIISTNIANPNVEFLISNPGLLFNATVKSKTGSVELAPDRHSVIFVGVGIAEITEYVPAQVPVLGGQVLWVADTEPFVVAAQGIPE